MWFKNHLELNPELTAHWRGRDAFAEIFNLQGEVYREQKNRKTLRFVIDDKAYFVKLHKGIGWKEIFKNLIQARLPVFGAYEEWHAIKHLRSLGVKTPQVVGYGCRGKNPARLESFIITRELPDTVSLETLCATWLEHPPKPRFKRTLINKVAVIARTLHQNGINHRDFYLAHFLLDVSLGLEQIQPNNIILYLIDLHRTQVRHKIPKRWLLKDLAGLYFSSFHVGLNKRDLLRFIKMYQQKPLHECLSDRNYYFWQEVVEAADKLYRKVQKNNLRDMQSVEKFSNMYFLDDATGKVLTCHQLLQTVPGKNWTFNAVWQQQAVMAKVFAHWADAEQELACYETLSKANVRLPTLIYHGWMRGGGLYLLIHEKVTDGTNLAVLWDKVDATIKERLLTILLMMVSRLHQAKIIYENLALKNFMVHGNELFALNMDKVKVVKGEMLTEPMRLKNIGLLFGQFPPRYDVWCEKLYAQYVQRSGEPFTQAGLARLKKWIAHARRQHLITAADKALYAGNQLISYQTPTEFWLCARDNYTPAMQVFLRDPEAILQGAAAKVIKSEKGVDVILMRFGGQRLLVKRYALKRQGIWGAIKYGLGKSRAALSWQNAHYLKILELGTPKPIAVYEKRWGFLRGNSYFITDQVTGISLRDYFKSTSSIEESMYVKDKVKIFFDCLADAKIGYNSLPAENVLLVGGQPYLMDVDGIRL